MGVEMLCWSAQAALVMVFGGGCEVVMSPWARAVGREGPAHCARKSSWTALGSCAF